MNFNVKKDYKKNHNSKIAILALTFKIENIIVILRKLSRAIRLKIFNLVFCTNRSQKIFVHHFFLSLQDFMKEPIISQDVFLAIDKNKDG